MFVFFNVGFFSFLLPLWWNWLAILLILPPGWASESVALSHHRRLTVLLFIHCTDLHCLARRLNAARGFKSCAASMLGFHAALLRVAPRHHITIRGIVGQWVRVVWIVASDTEAWWETTPTVATVWSKSVERLKVPFRLITRTGRGSKGQKAPRVLRVEAHCNKHCLLFRSQGLFDLCSKSPTSIMWRFLRVNIVTRQTSRESSLLIGSSWCVGNVKICANFYFVPSQLLLLLLQLFVPWESATLG